ncbi:MAG: hypothetical protein Q9160_007527 [Pyrenula sp. 1 TL-2023]
MDLSEALRTLGLSHKATEADISKAYRKLSLKWHPDRNAKNLDQANAMMAQINTARDVLVDGTARSASKASESYDYYDSKSRSSDYKQKYRSSDYEYDTEYREPRYETKHRSSDYKPKRRSSYYEYETEYREPTYEKGYRSSDRQSSTSKAKYRSSDYEYETEYREPTYEKYYRSSDYQPKYRSSDYDEYETEYREPRYDHGYRSSDRRSSTSRSKHRSSTSSREYPPSAYAYDCATPVYGTVYREPTYTYETLTEGKHQFPAKGIFVYD